MEQALVRAAVEARERATAPYSQFKVGAALLTKTGRIISGVNVESASYGLTCCAERVALFNALSQGERSFVAIAVVAAAEGGPMPCGACRQLLAEYAAGILILSADINDLEKTRRYSIEQLLPSPFLQVPQNSTT
jgi:cytidine deaminase